jgi:hypothetical protein
LRVRKRRTLLVLWSALLLPIVAFAQTAAAPKTLPVVFDDWWNVDYVKNGCQLHEENGNHCTLSPEETVREFESKVEVAFASESSCHGLVLLHFTPEMVHAAVKNPSALATGKMLDVANEHWQLMLDLDGLSPKQVGRSWTLSDPSGKTALNGRITTPTRLAQQICKIAKGVGGVVK